MLGDLGSLGKIMQIAGQLKTKLPEMKEKLDAAEYTAQAGGGMVTAKVNGKLKLLDIKLSPELAKDGQLDMEMLEDLVKAAISAAQSEAAEEFKKQIAELTGGQDIGGLSKMFGG